MILKYEIDSEKFTVLNEALKISKDEFAHLLRGGGNGSNYERIAKARQALGLSNLDKDMCHNFYKND